MGSAWAGPEIIHGCRSGPCCIQEASTRAAALRQAAQITSQLHSIFSAKPSGVMSMPGLATPYHSSYGIRQPWLCLKVATDLMQLHLRTHWRERWWKLQNQARPRRQ